MASGEDKKNGVHRQTSVSSQYHCHEDTGMPPARPTITMIASGQSVIFPQDTIYSGSTSFKKTVTENSSQPSAKNNFSSRVAARPKQFSMTSQDACKIDTASARDKAQYGCQQDAMVRLTKFLSRFSEIMKHDLAIKCPQLSVEFLEGRDDLFCVLKGTEQLVCDGKWTLERYEKELKCKNVYFTADVKEALHHLVVEKRINDRIFKRHPECTVVQNRNEILVYGLNETEIGKACLFVGQMFTGCESFLNGDLRSKKSEIEKHFQKKSGDELLVCVDSLYRLHLLGFKEAVDEANREFVALKEGRISMNVNHLSSVPYEDKVLYYQVRKSEIFSFIEQESLMKDTERKFGVSIVIHHNDRRIEIKGSSENTQHAYEHIEMIEKNICLTSITFDNPVAVRHFEGEKSNEYITSIGHRFHVLTEKEVFFRVGKTTVTKQNLNQKMVWSVSHGKKLMIEKNSMGNIQASLKANPVLLDTGETRKFERNGDIVTVGVPSFKDGNQSEEYGLEYVWTTFIRKAAEGKEKALGIPLAPIATWNIEKYVRCLVKSCAHWFLDWSDNSPECVILFTDNRDCFQRTDACVEELVHFLLKEMIKRPHIRVIRAELHQTEADVLVNTTSPTLDLSCGRVSTALSKSAGPGLQLECYRKYPDGIMHGMIATTGGHNLMCKEIFHITLSQYMKECAENIRETIMLCLYKSSERGFETIAFPVIGTGNLQYPEDIVVSEMFIGVERYRQDCPYTTLKEVRFVIFPKDTGLFEKFKKYEEKLLATPVTSSEPRCVVKINIIGARENILDVKAELDRKASTLLDKSNAETNRYRRKQPATNKGDISEDAMNISDIEISSDEIVGSFRSPDAKKVDAYEIGNLVIRVYKADILNIPVEGIVNAANQDLRHVGGVALAIAKAAGEKNLHKECEKAINKNKGPLHVSAVVCTNAGSLHFKHIIHAVGPRWSEYKPITDRSLRQCSDDLKKTITNCLMVAERKGLDSLVLPTVGSGRFGVPKDICAIQYAKALLEFSGKNDSLREVHIVDINDEMIDIVHKMFYAMFTDRQPAPAFSSRDYLDASEKHDTNMDFGEKKIFKCTGRDRPKSLTNKEVRQDDSTNESQKDI